MRGARAAFDAAQAAYDAAPVANRDGKSTSSRAESARKHYRSSSMGIDLLIVRTTNFIWLGARGSGVRVDETGE